MTWFIWLYVIPVLFILMIILPDQNTINQNMLTVIYITALCPIVNLLVMIGVIYKLCTSKDFISYINDIEIEQKLEELGKQFNKLFNKDK